MPGLQSPGPVFTPAGAAAASVREEAQEPGQGPDVLETPSKEQFVEMAGRVSGLLSGHKSGGGSVLSWKLKNGTC